MRPWKKITLLAGASALAAPLAAQDPEQAVEDATDVIANLRDFLTSDAILTLVLLFLFGLAVSRTIRWVLRLLAGRYARHRLRIIGLYPLLNVTFWFLLTLLYILSSFETNAILAFLASSTLVLGFAFKDTLADFISGLLLVAERPFQLGDRIALEGQYGEVKSINIRSTTIQTLDDSTVSIPNSRILNGIISNANSGKLDCMTVINLFLPIDVDTQQARRIAFEAVVTSPYFNYDRDFQILFFDQFTDRPVTNLRIKAYVLDAHFEKAFEGEVTETAKRSFREAGLYVFNGD